MLRMESSFKLNFNRPLYRMGSNWIKETKKSKRPSQGLKKLNDN